MKSFQIAVIGSAGFEEYKYEKPDRSMYLAAEEIGKELSQSGCITICGGKGGIMLSVAKGAKKAGGITAAEVSGNKRGKSNEYIDVEIVTGDNAFRGPSQLIGMCDAVISIGGGAGTLQELCVSYRMAKPVVLVTGYGGWTDKIAELDWLDERRTVKFVKTDSVVNAVRIVLDILNKNRK